MKKIYAQLYSIRDEMVKDYMGTLEKIAAMGYAGVEFAGYGGYAAKELKEKLDSLGLIAISSHVSLDRLTTHLEEEIEFLNDLGAKYLVCPWADITSVESALEHAKLFSAIGKKCAESDLIFAYHNHDHEFEESQGQSPLEVLFEHVDSRYVVLQPDLYWIAVAGLDPEEYLKINSSRCPVVHLKQTKVLGERLNVEAGEGVIDFKRMIMDYPEKDFIYEQETSSGTSLESMERSLRSLLSHK
ncbi:MULTISPECIES: sugar phosphate isomerase/epimerase [unclassified Fusibacter]|uniref:sugar phosphate isomerase/epimerase family protein n=1 Tax=unclassified Fusibacter TaxID=2624464 RepID=UPI00101155E7|nr:MULTISPECIES: TIM barrel protein [unclassified Fusibacter]MCK8059242.1 sugar phosphate isomerase/epimerase [Fusibacter sp. A2]NPE21294.1 sugar phosphate isomerase/epimerase [Fusibacter sp. A1]RXV62558.1 sugar phosphate isomerase/epimerase [Fusibacter sp. A1]